MEQSQPAARGQSLLEWYEALISAALVLVLVFSFSLSFLLFAVPLNIRRVVVLKVASILELRSRASFIGSFGLLPANMRKITLPVILNGSNIKVVWYFLDGKVKAKL